MIKGLDRGTGVGNCSVQHCDFRSFLPIGQDWRLRKASNVAIIRYSRQTTFLFLTHPYPTKTTTNRTRSEWHGKLSGVGECSHEELQAIGLSLLSLNLGKCETVPYFTWKLSRKAQVFCTHKVYEICFIICLTLTAEQQHALINRPSSWCW